MRWKALLAVVLIVVIVGLLLTTKTGLDYFEFLRNKVGEFFSVMFRKPPGELFEIVLTTSREPFFGQSYKVTNSSFSCSGVYQSIRFGEHVISQKTLKKVSIELKNIKGTFEYTKEGSIRLSGQSTFIEIDDLRLSSPRASRVEIEIVPLDFSLTNIDQDKITLFPVTGDIKRVINDKLDSVSLTNEKLEINDFRGELSFREGDMMLAGSASSIVGDKFSFM